MTYLGQRAAAPLVCVVHEAAGGVLGAAGLGVAHVPVGQNQARAGHGPGPGRGRGLRLQGRDLLQPGEAQVLRLVAGLLGHVALVAFGAAVLVVAAAHGLNRTRISEKKLCVQHV